ncbi:putative transcription factor p65 homolog [Aphidius gifuensis]|uniref:putative transcription factor p65 homolog n=1 Tax=Aphidius gifuensis TaxID=684658 RepID=UPI001CDC8A87|nr:putative transcription factor p65 homolog [Aphidius gifuensis]
MSFYNTPFIEIVEQPASATRFRYTGENRTETLLGRSSTKTTKTYFKIKIHNLQGPARVSVSCVSKNDPYHIHSHGLRFKDNNVKNIECVNGIVYFNLTPDNPVMEFKKIGIQSCKKNEVDQFIRAKMLMGHDPCNAGFDCAYYSSSSFDLSAVRLAIQAFVKVPMINTVVPIETAVTEIIYDSKTANNGMTICSVSHDSVPASGGQKIIILTEKIYKTDIEVWFYQLNDEDDVIWKAPGIFEPEDIHYQRAITLKTPAYSNLNIKEPVTIFIQLYRRSNKANSEFHEIKFVPDIETTEIRKRKRNALGNSSNFFDENSFEYCTCINCPQHAGVNTAYPAVAIDDLSQINTETINTQNYNELSKTTKANSMSNFVDNISGNDNKLVLKSLGIKNNNCAQLINVNNNFEEHQQTPGDIIENLDPSGLVEVLSESLSSSFTSFGDIEED